MQLRSTVISSGHATADSFSHQIILNSIGPVIAALLGGLVVTLICQRVQNHRAELRQQEDRKRAERERRAQISLDIMRIAFGFYTRLIEVTRVEQYEDKVSLGDLPAHYQDFRIDARVLEEQLRVYIPGSEARWLWHGVVDMLSLRYYRIAHKGARLDGMINTHAQHAKDQGIPASIRGSFLGPEDLRWDDRVVFHDRIMKKFEDMLTRVINVVVHYELDPLEVDPVVLSPGRGSRLGVSSPPDQGSAKPTLAS